MIKLLVPLALASVPLAVLAFKAVPVVDDDHDDGRTFHASLKGENEVPPVDTDARGTLKIHFAKDFSSAKVSFTLHDAVRITQAHFHCGDEGANGPIVIFLAGFHDRGWDIDGHWLNDLEITDQN